VFIALLIPATVVTLLDIPATVVTFDDIPATVVTLDAIPATVDIADDIPLTVFISFTIPATVDTSVIDCENSKALPELFTDSTLLADSSGNVRLNAVDVEDLACGENLLSLSFC
jgi:mRNA-degrading endonuclease toxin of MazEF toxin-antitoxin module